MIKFPKNKDWSYLNSGRVYGDLYNARNIQFDDEGRITLSKRPVSIYTSDDSASLGHLMAIVPYGTTYMLVTSSGTFTVDVSTLAVSAVASAPTTGIPETDALNWQNRAYVSSQTNLHYYDGSWTNSLKSLTDDVPHPLCVFESLNYLAVGNGNTVLLLDTSHTTSQTLTIPSDFIVTSIRYRQNNLYIGTKHKYHGEAKLFIWNGAGSAAQGSFGVKSNWVFSLEEFLSSIVCITNAGQLLRFNGGGFDILGNLPVYYSQRIWQDSTGSLAGKVMNRGMIADGNVLYINLDGDVAQNSNNFSPDGFLPNQPSGLWCYDPKIGFYPRSLSSADKYKTITVSSIDTSTDRLTLANATDALTGEPLLLSTDSITGPSTLNTYFLIRVSSTVIKLALTAYDAFQGNAIDISGTVGATTIRLPQYRNIGDITSSVTQGAVGLISSLNIPRRAFDSTILWGARLCSPIAINTSVFSICLMSTGLNIGSFELQRQYSDSIKDSWQKFILRYGGLNLDSEKIIIKSRSVDRFGTPSVIYDTGTWADSRVIMLTQSNKSLFPFRKGDEILIVKGSKAGYTTHITDIYGNAGGWRIGVADAIGTAGETLYFMVDTWKKRSTITNATSSNPEGYIEVPLTDRSVFLDIKVEMYGHELYVKDAIIINRADKLNR